MLAEFKQYLTQQQLAEIMNRDRTSASKVISRIKQENPELWAAYASNKHRELTRPTPAS